MITVLVHLVLTGPEMQRVLLVVCWARLTEWPWEAHGVGGGQGVRKVRKRWSPGCSASGEEAVPVSCSTHACGVAEGKA